MVRQGQDVARGVGQGGGDPLASLGPDSPAGRGGGSDEEVIRLAAGVAGVEAVPAEAQLLLLAQREVRVGVHDQRPLPRHGRLV